MYLLYERTRKRHTNTYFFEDIVDHRYTNSLRRARVPLGFFELVGPCLSISCNGHTEEISLKKMIIIIIIIKRVIFVRYPQNSSSVNIRYFCTICLNS